MIKLDTKYITDGVYFLSELKPEFEQKYLEIRKKENRVYSDDEVKLLPGISNTHVHYNEWTIRKKSAERFLEYISNKTNKLVILDVGCGNGWFSNRISKISNCQIIAVDVNEFELKQAARVFPSKNIGFIYGDIFENIFPEKEFDLIVLNSSIQYFPDLKKTIERLLKLLNDNGEIHLIDSPFYENSEIEKAKARSMKYFESIGFPKMTDHYFHHSIDNLDTYENTKMYDPESVINKIKRKLRIPDTPFPWIRIKKSQ